MVLVADFHTHPPLESQGGLLKPLHDDLNTVYGVPALIRHERSSTSGDRWSAVGYRIYGPERREFLTGNPGYPGLPPPGRAASCP
jgi:hypothetical protein